MAVPDTRLGIKDDGITFSALAYQTISGGQFVKAMSGDGLLTSTSTLDNVLNVDLADAVGDEVLVVGVALNNVVSGGRVTVATRGVHGFKAGAAVTAGALVKLNEGCTTADAVAAATADAGSKAIGRALSQAGSGQLVPVLLRV